jgi:hypothetical protein
VCDQTCAGSTTVAATLNGDQGGVQAGSCNTGNCAFKWLSPTTETAGTLALAATVGGTAVAQVDVVITPGEPPARAPLSRSEEARLPAAYAGPGTQK